MSCIYHIMFTNKEAKCLDYTLVVSFLKNKYSVMTIALRTVYYLKINEKSHLKLYIHVQRSIAVYVYKPTIHREM